MTRDDGLVLWICNYKDLTINIYTNLMQMVIQRMFL